jgi:tetratricopeptide (TPR) repeat protein
MKCHFKMLLFVLLALAAGLLPAAVVGGDNAELQQPKTAAAPQAEEQESPPGYEEEYNAWEAADKQTDPLKRGSMLIDFIQKYPKSTLLPNIEATYRNLLFECSNNKKFQELETLAEQWLKYHPNDFDTTARIADAAVKLGHDEKYLQRTTELYKMKPTVALATDIALTYQRMKNTPKYLEWIDIALKYPENESNFMMRSELVKHFADANDYAKAAEWANAALKAADLVKNPSAETQKQLSAVRHACHHLIGINQYQDKKYTEAMQSFQQALRAEKYGEGHFYIGQCLRQLGKAEEALVCLAKAEIMGGEVAPKAKAELEIVYKGMHNNTLIGIEKIYKKAKEQLD